MDNLTALAQLDARINEIYREQALTSLRGTTNDEDSRWLFEGVDLHNKYYTTTQPKESFFRMDIFDELVELSDQIVYFTAHTFMYREHINNPLNHRVHPTGYDKPLLLNYQNMPAKRYNAYLDTVAEKFYAYWTRLGHLLNYYLPKPLPTKAANFSIVMDQFDLHMSRYHQNEGYIWLKEYKENQMKDFNRERSTIVHHTTTGTAFSSRHRSADPNEMETVMAERLSRPEYFRDHIHLSLTALSKALDMIAEITPAPLVDAEAAS